MSLSTQMSAVLDALSKCKLHNNKVSVRSFAKAVVGGCRHWNAEGSEKIWMNSHFPVKSTPPSGYPSLTLASVGGPATYYVDFEDMLKIVPLLPKCEWQQALLNDMVNVYIDGNTNPSELEPRAQAIRDHLQKTSRGRKFLTFMEHRSSASTNGPSFDATADNLGDVPNGPIEESETAEPQDIAPQDTELQEAAPQEAAPQEAAPQDAAPQAEDEIETEISGAEESDSDDDTIVEAPEDVGSVLGKRTADEIQLAVKEALNETLPAEALATWSAAKRVNLANNDLARMRMMTRDIITAADDMVTKNKRLLADQKLVLKQSRTLYQTQIHSNVLSELRNFKQKIEKEVAMVTRQRTALEKAREAELKSLRKQYDSLWTKWEKDQKLIQRKQEIADNSHKYIQRQQEIILSQAEEIRRQQELLNAQGEASRVEMEN
jgi:hypothetical protein